MIEAYVTWNWFLYTRRWENGVWGRQIILLRMYVGEGRTAWVAPELVQCECRGERTRGRGPRDTDPLRASPPQHIISPRYIHFGGRSGGVV